MVKRPEGQTGFGRLPRRRVVERRLTWRSRVRHLARAYERLRSP